MLMHMRKGLTPNHHSTVAVPTWKFNQPLQKVQKCACKTWDFGKSKLGMDVDNNVQKHPVEHGILEDPTQ
jgi:hypothetical protein